VNSGELHGFHECLALEVREVGWDDGNSGQGLGRREAIGEALLKMQQDFGEDLGGGELLVSQA